MNKDQIREALTSMLEEFEAIVADSGHDEAKRERIIEQWTDTISLEFADTLRHATGND